ncbi:MAG: metallophosphoesterase [Nitrososphaeraceae archaeon]|jgi:predicted phosphodiesterase
MRVYYLIFTVIITSLTIVSSGLINITYGQANETSQTIIHENSSEGLSSFTFNVAGDFRDTPATGYNLVSDNPDFIIMTGDYGIKTKNPKEWTSSTMAMIKNSGIPVYGALGNNDNGNEYLNTGFFTNKNWSYSFAAGDIAFVVANTEDENVAGTDAFLARAQNDPNVKWIIVVMHESIWHPVGTSVRSDTTIDFHSTFQKYSKVKMVIAGHTHVYARMVPVDGILYIMNGIGGQNPSKGPTEPSTFSKINGALHCRVTVDGSITCSNISNGSGAVVDKFTIEADGTLPTDGTPVRQ